jgi:hypothetical protein
MFETEHPRYALDCVRRLNIVICVVEPFLEEERDDASIHRKPRLTLSL